MSEKDIIKKQTYRTQCLFKFGEKEHMQALYEKGEIHCRTFEYFKNLEDNGDGRADKNEYLTSYYAGSAIDDNISITLTVCKKEGQYNIPLTRKDGLQFFKMECSQKEFSHLYCLSVFEIGFVKQKDGYLLEQFSFDERNTYGDKKWAIIIYNPERFFKKIDQSLRKKVCFGRRGFVNYIDKNNYAGEMGCFKKFDDYAYQSEYRIAINNPNEVDWFNFHIGSLSDIALPPMDISQFLGGVTNE